MKIEIEISEDKAREFVHFLYLKKLCGNLAVGTDPIDTVGILIAEQIIDQTKRRSKCESPD